jgi:hypothetical protein
MKAFALSALSSSSEFNRYSQPDTEFCEAVAQQATNRKQAREIRPLLRPILEPNNWVFVKQDSHCWLVRLGDISVFESYGNYTRGFLLRIDR